MIKLPTMLLHLKNNFLTYRQEDDYISNPEH